MATNALKVPSNYSILNRIGAGTIATDPARSFMWTVSIPTTLIQNIIKNSPKTQGFSNLGGIADKILMGEDFLVKCRGASIPSKSIPPIATSFYGQKRLFPSKTEFSNVLDLDFEETEAQTFKSFFDNWQSLIHNANFHNNPIGKIGHSSVTSLYYMGDIKVSLINYNGMLQNKSIVFYNCWPREVKEYGLTYGSNEIIKYSVSLSFDYWQLNTELIPIQVPYLS